MGINRLAKIVGIKEEWCQNLKEDQDDEKMDKIKINYKMNTNLTNLACQKPINLTTNKKMQDEEMNE